MSKELVTEAQSEAALMPLQGLDRDKLYNMLYQMILIRRFEEKAAELYLNERKIGGFCHLYIGQEAVAVGAMASLRKDDYVFSSYRDHGHALVKGMSGGEVMAELFGRIGGCAKGKGGSMHMFSREVNFLGGHGIVGGHIPLATGSAFASKYRGDDRVTVCFFGEAAVNIGAFHESLNMASLWKLPVVYICENNRYGMGTALERAASLYDLSEKARAYNMAHAHVDGQDLLAMYDVTNQAIERARHESLPTFIEARTYRFVGHSISDPAHGHYRTKEEVEEYKQRDPIKTFTAMLIEHEMINENDVKDIESRVRSEVDEAVRFADESPIPPAEELYTDVYIQPL
ncbi:MAG TPA: pyruvate dehydrogenase (acetyl-transferring) E1 component subunit alpha [Blastocatellia bacterium]|nr:pyruvate dehydrogenase (acetyl-transferring) E1 component subunit alpha [Blastocatellia bacterium]